ncbi:hypothetical protein VKT23_011890 [Stygiomarasmius scandens]|uniref:Uncharacterized protein n=1 Tax=Marasmiellus scandens TaxID=2682957 RepID=A0ABR1J886_9AGAR
MQLEAINANLNTKGRHCIHINTTVFEALQDSNPNPSTAWAPLRYTQILSMTERPTTLFLYGDDVFGFPAATNPASVTPIGTAEDGSQTTLQYAFVESDAIQTNGPVVTRTDTAIVVVSSGGFREVQSALDLVTGTNIWPGWTQVYDCVATDGNEGRCLISGNGAQPAVATGTGIPWVLFVTESSSSSTSGTLSQTTPSESTPSSSPSSSQSFSHSKGFFSNKSAVIGTFVSIGVALVAILLLLMLRLSRRRRRPMTDDLDTGKQPKLRTVSGWTPSVPDVNQVETARNSLNPHQIISEKIPEVYNNEKKNPVFLSVDNSIPLASSSQPGFMSTPRQVLLKEQADDLRAQIQELQRTVNTSNQGMQLAIARMMAHLQSLESQSNSDWAMGLTDKPPPGYEAG